MEITKREHNGYTEWVKSKELQKILHEPYFGQWQYLCKSNKGEISLIELTDKFYGDRPWEIYCLEGNLFDDVQRFPTQEEAMSAIRTYLD